MKGAQAHRDERGTAADGERPRRRLRTDGGTSQRRINGEAPGPAARKFAEEANPAAVRRVRVITGHGECHSSEPFLFDECYYSSELERLELSQTTFVAVCCGVFSTFLQ